MLDETAVGVFTIAVTPFLPDGRLDLESVDRMVDFYLEKGATGPHLARNDGGGWQTLIRRGAASCQAGDKANIGTGGGRRFCVRLCSNVHSYNGERGCRGCWRYGRATIDAPVRRSDSHLLSQRG